MNPFFPCEQKKKIGVFNCFTFFGIGLGISGSLCTSEAKFLGKPRTSTPNFQDFCQKLRETPSNYTQIAAPKAPRTILDFGPPKIREIQPNPLPFFFRANLFFPCEQKKKGSYIMHYNAV